MKTKIFLILAFFAFCLTSFAQTSMSDDQVMKYLVTEYNKGTSQQKIVSSLLEKGVTVAQLQRVRKKAETMKKQESQNPGSELKNQSRTRKNVQPKTSMADEQIGEKVNQVHAVNEDALYMADPNDSIEYWLEQEKKKEGRKVFGRNIFNNENLSFQPSSNIATPQNYILGAGDAVNIDIWGASQKSITETISPDGTVVIEGVGPVKLGGLSVSKAKANLKSQLGRYYSDCNFDLTVGETKTIQVQVLGEVNTPGTYSLSGLSSAFNALYAAGGISEIGTLRNIKVYRSGRHIATIDVYDYLVNGSNSSDIRLNDNDVIIVGPYECLVNIDGKVKRPMWYEMKSTETVKQLLKYAGGFTGDAYTQNVRLTRKAGSEYSIHTVEEFDMANFKLCDEDVVEVDSVRTRFSNLVEIRGAVKHAGKFQLGGNIQSVKELLTAADGLREDAYQKRAIMHREKDDMTLEMISVDVDGILNGTAADIPLKKNDVLFIPSSTEMLGERTIQVNGEVTYPGTYPYAENTSIKDIILQAGGMTNAGSLAKVDVFRRIPDAKSETSGTRLSESFSFALDEAFNTTQDTTFYLKPFDIVIIRKSPSYNEQQTVTVQGEVNFQGKYSMTTKNFRLSDLIKACGGVTSQGSTQAAHLTRYMTKEELEHRDRANEKAQIELYESALKEGKEMNMQIADSLLAMKKNTDYTFPVAINLDKALANPGSEYDLVLRKGDVLEIPEHSDIVKVSGEVMYPVSMSYEKEKSLSYYISHAGGYSSNAHRTKVYGIHANGSVVRLHANSVHDIQPGMEIVVPQKAAKKKMSTAEIFGITSGVASVGVIIVSLLNVLK